MRDRYLPALLLGWGLTIPPASAQVPSDPAFTIGRGDRIVFIGNTFAERMQLFPHFEALLTAHFPEDSLTFRNLGWSADEVALQPRPLNFGDLHTHLTEQRADVIFACFGMNESFAGSEDLPRFRSDLVDFLKGLLDHRYNGATPPRVVLVSPVAHEHVQRVHLDAASHNRDLALYTRAMQDVAAELGVRFIDLFTPTLELWGDPALGDLTINGIHLNEHGYRLASRLMAGSLGLLGPRLPGTEADRLARREGVTLERVSGLERLQQAIREKNELFFYRWRPVNGEYVYGRRKEPFGVVNFPPEMRQLEEMIRAKEREIWTLAKAESAKISRKGRDISTR